jgi:hypothetical protein
MIDRDPLSYQPIASDGCLGIGKGLGQALQHHSDASHRAITSRLI